jgi:uncharacterized membrane protein YsdA (DUF1294 family)
MPQVISDWFFAAGNFVSGFWPLPVPVLLGYYIPINLITFFLYLRDKRLAIGNRRRIPEAVLLGWTAFGGAAGALCGMRIFHHKTRKPKFRILVPLFLLLHAALIFFCFFGGIS